MAGEGTFENKKIMWYMYKEIVLTKDNLAKRN
jgi:hypothetical protein